MEPLIDPYVFYWIDVLSTLKGTFRGAGTFFSILSVIAIIFLTAILDNEPGNKSVIKVRKFTVIALPFFVLMLVTAIFIPREATMYKMLAAKNLTKDSLENATEFIEDFASRVSCAVGNDFEKVKFKADIEKESKDE